MKIRYSNLFAHIQRLAVALTSLTILISVNSYSQVLDSTFGIDGIVTISIEERKTHPDFLELLNDESIIVGLNTSYSLYGALFDQGFYIYKLKTDGSIDTSFGSNGYYYQTSGNPNNYDYYSEILSLVFNPIDNHIYVLANVISSLKLFKIDINGVLNTNFGINGYV